MDERERANAVFIARLDERIERLQADMKDLKVSMQEHLAVHASENGAFKRWVVIGALAGATLTGSGATILRVLGV